MIVTVDPDGTYRACGYASKTPARGPSTPFPFRPSAVIHSTRQRPDSRITHISCLPVAVFHVSPRAIARTVNVMKSHRARFGVTLIVDAEPAVGRGRDRRWMALPRVT